MAKSVIETLENRVLLSVTPNDLLNPVDVPWGGHTVKAIANEYVVQAKAGVDFTALAKRFNLPVSQIKDLGGGGFYSFKARASVKEVAHWVTRFDRWLIVLSPNGVVRASETRPDDPMYDQQWHLNNTGQTIIDPITKKNYMGIAGSDINVEKAWDIVTGDTQTDPKKQIVVAVLDTGIDLTHPDLQANLFTNTLEIPGDGIDNDGNGYVDDVNGWNSGADNGIVTDNAGHGTHVSGIIGATGNNGIGVTGVDWHVKIMPVNVLGSGGNGFLDSVLQGIRYIVRMKEEGWNIVAVNASLGGGEFPFNEIESRAVEQLGERGVLFVAAAGNDSANNDRFHSFPAKYSLNLPNVITVAATDNQDKLASFSNYGFSSVQVAAPGFLINSTYPLAFDVEDGDQDGYTLLSGTSMAAPVVTGIIALEKAAKPNASAAQLKQALLDSVDVLPSLSSVNSLPALVSTSGRVNAFKAIKDVLNQNSANDSIRQGNWVGAYGAQGAYIVGESTTFPSFVEGRFTGDSTQVELSSSTTKPQALQRADNPADRISAYQATPSLLEIDLNFTDGQSHRVGIYCADLDNKGRVQHVSLTDADTGVVMNTQAISKFSKGRYIFWDVIGHVKIQLAPEKGPNAVFSGLFFDVPPATPTLLANTDSTTRGQWLNKYGSQGQVIVYEPGTIPSYVANLVVSGKNDVVLKPVTSDAGALAKPTDLSHGIISYYTSPTSFDIDLSFNDGKTHRTSFYFLDSQNRKRQQKIEVFDATGTNLLSRQDIGTFQKGLYLTYDFTEAVKIRVTNIAGPNAVLNGMFFDGEAGSQAEYLGNDLKSQGSWKRARYGTVGQYIVGASGNYNEFNATQAFVALTEPAGSQAVLNILDDDITTDRRALQNPLDETKRIKAELTNTAGLSIDVKFTDNRTHRLALYAADYEKLGRSQRIKLVDPATGQVLSSYDMNKFSKGQYLIWNIRGQVQIQITTLTTQSVTFSGLMFD